MCNCSGKVVVDYTKKMSLKYFIKHTLSVGKKVISVARLLLNVPRKTYTFSGKKVISVARLLLNVPRKMSFTYFLKHTLLVGKKVISVER